MNNKEAAEYIKAHCNPDMTQKTQWEIAIVMAVKALLSGQQKGNIEEDPTIDAVKVVRCKDCRHFFRDDMGNVVVYRCELNHEDMRDDFYCADGERGEDE